jgi:hypothetical protein
MLLSTKTAHIDRLAEGIKYISTDFERFGGVFLDALLGIPMSHRGTNLRGFPVSRVLDSDSDDGLVVAQYSAEKDYFDGDMQKAQGDLLQAIVKQPTATSIYLLSSERKRPQIAEAFEARMRQRPEMQGKSLHLWGSEEVARKIIEELLLNGPAIKLLVQYLPLLQRIVDEEVATGLIPKPDRPQIIRDSVDSALTDLLRVKRGVSIGGIGGLGKSAAAAAYADRHEEEYHQVIWLDGSKVKDANALYAMPLYRGGEHRNVAALLRTRICLLIIDDADPELKLESLLDLCGPGSQIILTERRLSRVSYELPLLERPEAELILNHDVGPCPPAVFDVIWGTVKGHPLTLGLMNAAVHEGAPWSDIESDCQAVGEFEDGAQRLADRLLGRLKSLLERELGVFAWAGQSSCSRDFLEAVIQPLGLRKLRSNGLTSLDRQEISRLHDIVFAALSADEWCKPSRRQELDLALENYLIRTNAESGLRFWTAARSLRSKLERLVAEGSQSAVFRYALLSIWDTGEMRLELIPNPVEQAEALRGTEPTPLLVISIIEAIEQLFLLDKKDGDRQAADRLRLRLGVFDILMNMPALSELERAQILHHKGKAFKRLGEAGPAAVLFEEVLAGPVPLSETRLQLIDVYRSDPGKMLRAVALADEILTQSLVSEEVSYSVFLGAVERLPWGGGNWRSELFRKHAQAIEETIVKAAELGVQQAYRTFGAIGRYLSTEHPALFSSIFARLTKPAPQSLQSDDDRFAWGEIYFEASRLPTADDVLLRGQALQFYEAEKAPQRFHLQRKAELLIDMGRAAEGEAMLRAREDLNKSEWLQRLMARACLAQGNPTDALIWIDSALSQLKAEHFRSEFFELRYDVRKVLGDEGALDDLKNALAASEKQSESDRLRRRLREAG